MNRPNLDDTKRFKTLRAQFRIPADDWAVFKAMSERYGFAPSSLIRLLVTRWMDAKKCLHGVPVHGGITCDECKRITERKG